MDLDAISRHTLNPKLNATLCIPVYTENMMPLNVEWRAVEKELFSLEWGLVV